MEEYNGNNEFDLKVRSILENAAEEIPAGLWSGVERRLPAAATSARQPVFLRVIRYSASVVAAACLTVGVVFTARQKSGAGRLEVLNVGPVLTDVPEAVYPTVASASELPEMAGRVPVAVTSRPDIRPILPESARADAGEFEATSSEEPSVVTDTEPEISDKAGENAPAATISPENKPVENTAVRPLEDYFPADPEAKKSGRRPTVSLGAYTNAASNGTSSKGGAAMMKKLAEAGVDKAPKTSVTETSTPIYGIPVSAGIAVKINFTERWALGVGVNYSYLSSRFNGTHLKEDGSYENFSNIRKELHYIGIPVNAYFNIVRSDIVNFYTFAGGSIEKCVSDKYRMVSPENGTIIHKEKVPGLQYSAGLGLGVEFNLAPHFGLYIDPSVRYWFNSGQPTSIRTQQPFMAQLDLGFRVNF